ncbi:MAG: glycosyl transferase [Verrucomicrobiota bacterium]
MTDFHQPRLVSTIHQLTDPDIDEREKLLKKCAARRPISLILPALYSEVRSPALPLILSELSKVDYLHEVVFSMNRMSATEFSHAKSFIKDHLGSKQAYSIIWNDGERVSALYDQLAKAELTSYVPGKGYNVWMAYGYLLAKGETRVVATHDSDILSYHRDMLWRLCLPTTHPNMGFEYCKSYYGRVSDRMYGRATRLFVIPLLRALTKVIGDHPLLEYLENFRYPLSGEFSCSAELAKVLMIPGDWGLEVGMLCEVYRNITTRRICQVDLGMNFEHKHQHLGADDVGTDPDVRPSKGLMKMAHDIALTLLAALSADGVVLGRSDLKTIRLTYIRTAKDLISRYRDDAILNALSYHRHEEAAAVEAFSLALDSAAHEYVSEKYQPPEIPSWNRVNSALPNLGDELLRGVLADMEE